MKNLIDYLALFLAFICSILGLITENYESFLGWLMCCIWIIICKITENQKL